MRIQNQKWHGFTAISNTTSQARQAIVRPNADRLWSLEMIQMVYINNTLYKI